MLLSSCLGGEVECLMRSRRHLCYLNNLPVCCTRSSPGCKRSVKCNWIFLAAAVVVVVVAVVSDEESGSCSSFLCCTRGCFQSRTRYCSDLECSCWLAITEICTLRVLPCPNRSSSKRANRLQAPAPSLACDRQPGQRLMVAWCRGQSLAVRSMSWEMGRIWRRIQLDWLGWFQGTWTLSSPGLEVLPTGRSRFLASRPLGLEPETFGRWLFAWPHCMATISQWWRLKKCPSFSYKMNPKLVQFNQVESWRHLHCGLVGMGASLSITTLRGGGGMRFPEMVITFLPTGQGGIGGASLITNGSGVAGLGGCCLKTTETRPNQM